MPRQSQAHVTERILIALRKAKEPMTVGELRFAGPGLVQDGTIRHCLKPLVIAKRVARKVVTRKHTINRGQVIHTKPMGYYLPD